MRAHIRSASALHIILGGGALLTGLTSVGCGPKNVRWDYSPDGPQRLSQSKRVAVLADEEIHALAAALDTELTARGYIIVPWPERPPAPGEAEDSAADETRRPQAAPEVGADLLFELSAEYVKEPEPNTKVNVWPWVKVEVAYGHATRPQRDRQVPRRRPRARKVALDLREFTSWLDSPQAGDDGIEERR